MSHVEDTAQSSSFWVCVAPTMQFYFTVVYASTDRLVRRDLWIDLLNFTAAIGDIPWLVGGNFNAVTCSSEVVSKYEFGSHTIEEFGDFINYAGLMELNHTGNPLSWCNNQK